MANAPMRDHKNINVTIIIKGADFTLQLDLVFWTVDQYGADRVQIVIVAASERPSSGFRHL